MVRRSRSTPLPEPASLTNSLKICERCRLGELPSAHLGQRIGRIGKRAPSDSHPVVSP
jgi:hypothetical protein